MRFGLIDVLLKYKLFISLFVGVFAAYILTVMGDFVGYRPRSAFARAVISRMQDDNIHRDSKHEHWYRIEPEKLPEELCDTLVPLYQDEETTEFLNHCIEKADWVFTEIFHSIASTILGFFMSKTQINGILGRGSMFVLSHQQLETLLNVSPVKKSDNMIDLGAGDGEVTNVLASYFQNVFATEMSTSMQKALSSKGFQVLDVDGWDNGTIQYDVISCLNLLDRCDKPVSMLRSMRNVLRPGSGRVLVALVIPFNPYVEFDSEDHIPTENMRITGSTFEEQISQLVRAVFKPAGFQVEAVSRVPYLCEGDLRHSFYVLTDAIFVLKAAES